MILSTSELPFFNFNLESLLNTTNAQLVRSEKTFEQLSTNSILTIYIEKVFFCIRRENCNQI